jgi:KipI family sensor histidine kinase inhibitor
VSGRWPRLLPTGDRGLLVEFASDVSVETAAIVLGADAALAGLPGIVETVPALRSVLVVYDPLTVGFDRLAEQVEAAVRTAGPVPIDAGRLIEVPVVYGGVDGPDLETVARACGLDAADVVRLHSEPSYFVMMLGFAPGFPYLGSLPARLRVPRRATPRTRVPAGSVAIADRFTGIYPQATAGGWHLLGRAVAHLFDPNRSPPCLLAPGDRVRFVPVERTSTIAAGRPAAPPAHPPAPRAPVFEVQEPGLLTTVQDLGRPGWRRVGIPASGALDRGAFLAVNAAAGNPPDTAALEFTFPGPKLRVLAEARVAIAGADFGARLNRAPLDPLEPVLAQRGDVLEFTAPRHGQWAYLAVAGGIDVPAAFGSRSTYARGELGGYQGRSVRAGDVLGRDEGRSGAGAIRPAYAVAQASGPVRVILGPQTGEFAVDAQAAWLSRTFEATVQRDRSGMRFRGPGLGHRRSAEILSDGLLPGSVQVPADGQPIVILADGPTTGGYAKIATVITADLDRLAQAPPGTPVRFEAVSVAEAHEAWKALAAGYTRHISRQEELRCSSDVCHG